MNKEDLKTYFGCAGWFLAIILLFKACDWYSSYQNDKQHKTYIEKKRNDSIREVFIRDSLAHDPHYQDSLRNDEIKYKKWKEEQDAIEKAELVGFLMAGDSVYHTSFHTIGFTGEHSYGFMIFVRPKLKFITNNEAKASNLKLCEECDDMESVYLRYIDNELIDRDNAKDYDLIPIEEAVDYCHHYHDDC